MPIDPDEAVAIARRHGLTLHDAAALADLAANPQHGEALARTFRGPAAIDFTADRSTQRAQLDAVMSENLTRLAELRARTDHNGWQRPEPPAGPSAPPPAEAPPPPPPPVDVDQLRSGANPGTLGPTIDDQIRAAEAAGDWDEVVRLGAEKLRTIRDAQEGH